MFFRREKQHPLSFDDRLARLRESEFNVQGDGGSRARVTKYGCSATIEDHGKDAPRIGVAGVVAGNEVGELVHGGYQQFFVTPSGKQLPALAQQLRALHDFQEDLKEALGITSLYNTSLGTTSDRHMYDRVKGREKGSTPTPAH